MTEDRKAQEAGLRALLERAVPELAAPEGRMRRVRERVVRRRRRRAAVAGGALAVAGVLLAGGVLRPESLPAPQGPPASPATVPADPAVRYPELAGLSLRLPPGWYGLHSPARPGLKAGATGFAAPQRLTPYEETCRPAPDVFCAPLERLDADGALLVLRISGQPSLQPKVRPGRAPNRVRLSGSCRALGGAHEYVTLLDAPEAAGTGSVLVVTACLGRDGDRRLEEIRQILATAAYDTSYLKERH
ncbi:hypothetical protein [Streptomyces purpureus]|uniref:Uncharacterized protein n=1 Tax=Streptomyces purpureus TaxID=1951 RepID=A0A918GY59_9ACTN|nr:hypothetical protein [Streptomyces purpureus]GGT20251.1 hypothetical protein GCM10014713_11280 [Streptomyces purpureus]